ncbi:hypothetical protein B4113_0471 [Geobacillus sp. B4113_201601]|nr:hypothetical protein B4113_0471 [Geobacillus sp. B4113_201601]
MSVEGVPKGWGTFFLWSKTVCCVSFQENNVWVILLFENYFYRSNKNMI